MALEFDSLSLTHQLSIGGDPQQITPPILGTGEETIRGSGWVEGPLYVGNPYIFPNVWATTMIGPLTNIDSTPAIIPGGVAHCGFSNHSPYSLAVIGDTYIEQHLDVTRTVNVGQKINCGGDIVARGNVMSQCGGHVLSAKKNFDIPHPSKVGWRLRHTCPEGPSNDVYYRGRITNTFHIDLPDYWENFVDEKSITVNLTPVGISQTLFVDKIKNNKIYIRSKNNLSSIDCYFHVFGERKDGDKLVSEYVGLTPNDYPGDNREYNINT